MQKELNICYAFNENYAAPSAVSMASLLENNRDFSIVFHILYSNLKSSTIERLSTFSNRYKNAKFNFVKIDETKFEKFNISIPYITKETYYRYLIADALDISRVLYLDGDTIINGDISVLFDIDLMDFYCAGVRDIYVESIAYQKQLNINGVYINAGVILFNLEKIRQERIVEKLFKFSIGRWFKYQDQDVLNIVFDGKIKEVDCLYNFNRHHQKETPQRTSSAKIIHYIGSNKPWKKYSFYCLKRFYYKYENLSPLTKKRNCISKLFWIISTIIKG